MPNLRLKMNNKLLEPELFILLVVLISYLCLPGTVSHYVRDWSVCTQDVRGAHWRLVHRYEFEDEAQTDREWQIMNEEDKCSDKNQYKCNSDLNVWTQYGYLILFARPEELNSYRISGATLTSKEKFTMGRWMMRIKFSSDMHLQLAIFTTNPVTKYWHGRDKTDLAMFAHNSNKSLVNPINQTTGSKVSKFVIDVQYLDNEVSFNQDSFLDPDVFHIIGIEWTTKQLQFFIDNQYSTPILLDKSKNQSLESHHNLSMEFGLDGQPPNDPSVLSVFLNDSAQWHCPAVIIDYIRIYESNSGKFYCQTQDIENPKEKNEKGLKSLPENIKEHDSIEKICVMSKIKPKRVYKNTPLSQRSIIMLILVFSIFIALCLIIYFIVRIRTIRSQIAETNRSNAENHYEDNENYYEVYKEENKNIPNGESAEIDKQSKDYLNLENADIDNKYTPMNPSGYLEMVDLKDSQYTCMEGTKV